MIASHGETHRDGGSMNLRKNTAIESKDCRQILKITKGNALFKAHISSMKFPSASESMRAAEEIDEPGQRRTTVKMVQVLREGERAVALASTPRSTD